MNLPKFYNCGCVLVLFLNVIYECKPMLNKVNDGECPSPCTCFVNFVDCSTLDLKESPSLSDWVTNVSLSWNFLPVMPVFNNSSNIITLDLSHNIIKTVSATSLIVLKHLKVLDLSSNKLMKITRNSFPHDTKIQILVLNSNEIMSVEEGSFDSLQELIELKLNRNHISHLSKDLFKLKNLNVLEMNRNKLTEIEGLSFHVLERLSVLKLRRNSITTLLDGAFWGLKNAATLHLDYNNLTAVTKSWLYGLSSLHELFLNHNSITFIEPGGWEFCPLLVQLELSSNRISWTIEDFNGAFVGLRHLNRFDLAWNHIKSIDKKAFLGLERLRILDLSGNDIITIQENPFEDMHHLEYLMINSTRLLCDCNLKWFPRWHERRSLFGVDTFCSYPANVRNMPTVGVPLSEFKCDEFPQPQLLEEPKAQVALRGGNVTLYCRAVSSSHLPMSFLWRKDNLDLKHGHLVQFAHTSNGKTIEHNSQLTLVNITDSDSGKYQCVVSNNYGSAYSAKSKISVLIFPKFTRVPVNVTAKSGSTARLECAATGQPQPQIAWQKDGGIDFPAARERRMHVMPSDVVFFIVNIKAADSGSYSCMAKNQAGTIVANATVTVLESPKFVKPMENKEITAGTSIVLECMASGSPKPTLTWTKDGHSLVATERHFFTAEDQLLIIVATDESDAGTYECELSNILGSRKEFSHLSIIPASSVALVENDMTGIIIITVVCCAVLTSIIWVFIIYHTRKRMGGPNVSNFTSTLLQHSTDLKAVSSPSPPQTHFYVDTNSEHSTSKDSGTGDSAKRSTNDLLLEHLTTDAPTNQADGEQGHDQGFDQDCEDIHEKCSEGDCSQCWLTPHYRKDDEYSYSSLHGAQVNHRDSIDEKTPCIQSVQSVVS
ncbi:leucine-rich repeats and immunoglobulin-like domains protein 3 isoform X2 [Bacillus rossius redtenbacheri]|uniref:leucine-rich repeats and immunoglobulin-like domains protein 3 isoform X2 n=1 Tax=Bacillus rossius redtenbacheri TaxID=93214 RepID=UPI002FDE50E7